MKLHIINISVLMLLTAFFCSCGKDTFDKPDYFSTKASTELGQIVVDGSDGYIAHVKSDRETHFADGITMLELSYIDNDGHAMQMFMYKVVLGSANVIESRPKDGLAVQKLTQQATSIENQGRYSVYGAVTGGGIAEGADCFFSILQDGQAVCLSGEMYAEFKDKAKYAMGGGSFLLKDGYLLNQSDAALLARSAVGVSEDGCEVYLVVVDGGDFYYSNGITCIDLAMLMKGCGADDAMTLSAGADVTAVWRNERLESLFGLLNKPSDKGLETEVAGGLVVVQY